MNLFKKKTTYLFTVLVFLLALGSFIAYQRYTTIHSIEEYNAWLNNKNNGCIVSREIAGMITTVKYQPPSYVVLREIAGTQTPGSRTIDSLINRQNNTLTFLMNIKPGQGRGKEKRNGMMYEGVNDYNDYVQRVMATNFSMEQYVSLYIDGESYHPVLSAVENVYELSEGCNFTIVFVKDNKHTIKKNKDLLFVYNDPFFDMGKVQFAFSGQDLDKAGNVTIAWN